MMRPTPRRRLRAGRSPVAVVVYLVGFMVLLFVVSNYYLLPMIKATATADPEAKKILSANARLVMVLILFVLLMGLLLTFRVSRFFRPRQSTPAKPTEYVDAWKESGRRLKVPKQEIDE